MQEHSDQAEPTVDLSIATIQDIIQELRRRNLSFALCLNLLAQYRPGRDIPSEERIATYGDDFAERNPAFLASAFCEGIQMALNEVDEPEAMRRAVKLSRLVTSLRSQLWQLAKLIDPSLS